MRFLRVYGIYLGWVIALTGMLMSLYFSEFRHFEPCRVCSLQRFCLFPLSIQLGIFAYRFDTSAVLYALPLCIIGLVSAILQSFGLVFHGSLGCTFGASCNENMIYFFHVIPFSWISAVGFALIGTLVWMGKSSPL